MFSLTKKYYPNFILTLNLPPDYVASYTLIFNEGLSLEKTIKDEDIEHIYVLPYGTTYKLIIDYKDGFFEDKDGSGFTHIERTETMTKNITINSAFDSGISITPRESLNFDTYIRVLTKHYFLFSRPSPGQNVYGRTPLVFSCNSTISIENVRTLTFDYPSKFNTQYSCSSYNIPYTILGNKTYTLTCNDDDFFIITDQPLPNTTIDGIANIDGVKTDINNHYLRTFYVPGVNTTNYSILETGESFTVPELPEQNYYISEMPKVMTFKIYNEDGTVYEPSNNDLLKFAFLEKNINFALAKEQGYLEYNDGLFSLPLLKIVRNNINNAGQLGNILTLYPANSNLRADCTGSGEFFLMSGNNFTYICKDADKEAEYIMCIFLTNDPEEEPYSYKWDISENSTVDLTNDGFYFTGKAIYDKDKGWCKIDICYDFLHKIHCCDLHRKPVESYVSFNVCAGAQGYPQWRRHISTNVYPKYTLIYHKHSDNFEPEYKIEDL